MSRASIVRAAGLCGLLWLAGCQVQEAQGKAPSRSAVTDVASEHYEAPALPRARVLLRDAYGGAHQVDVEVASTPQARTRGLMWRKELPAGQGMLFVFPEDAVQRFWMRNTLIPLDLVFIDSERRVVGIISRAEPRTTESRSVGVPSRYVLEVPGGWCETVGVQRGSTVELDGL